MSTFYLVKTSCSYAVCYLNLQRDVQVHVGLIQCLMTVWQAIQEVNEKLANGTFRRVQRSKVVVELQEAGLYYVAEKYHQQYLARGGRFGQPQSAEKGATDKIRCYG